MKILFSSTSPFVRKCLVAGAELGLNSSIELVASAAAPIERDKEIIALNPLGQVPTFICDDGVVLYDSRVICEYLNDIANGQLIPSDRRARWQALTLQALGDGMLNGALLARYEDVLRPKEIFWETWKSAQLDKVETCLAFLEVDMSRLQSVSIGSVAVACALWYVDLRFPDLNWRSRYPLVEKWYSHFSTRPSMNIAWTLPA